MVKEKVDPLFGGGAHGDALVVCLDDVFHNGEA